jgi:hypothetical protein
MATISERVQAGIELLDSKQPGWRERVSVPLLDMQLRTRCVVGQVFGSYGAQSLALLGLGNDKSGAPYGFYTEQVPNFDDPVAGCASEKAEFRALENEWKARLS